MLDINFPQDLVNRISGVVLCYAEDCASGQGPHPRYYVLDRFHEAITRPLHSKRPARFCINEPMGQRYESNHCAIHSLTVIQSIAKLEQATTKRYRCRNYSISTEGLNLDYFDISIDSFGHLPHQLTGEAPYAFCRISPVINPPQDDDHLKTNSRRRQRRRPDSRAVVKPLAFKNKSVFCLLRGARNKAGDSRPCEPSNADGRCANITLNLLS
jgi:hypothetical protein